MLHPAQVAVEEGAQIVHSIFEHGEPVDAGAEGEALPFVGVEPVEEVGLDRGGGFVLRDASEDVRPGGGAAFDAGDIGDQLAALGLGKGPRPSARRGSRWS